MELISKLLNIDFASLLPELPKFMVYIRLLMVLALLAGPVAMLILACFVAGVDEVARLVIRLVTVGNIS